jgi:3-phosphoshikimate 1-carboxyvinyltransferase
MLAGLSNGVCEITGFLPSEDCLNTVKAMEQLGAGVEIMESGPYGPLALRITGTNGKLKQPDGPVDCGNSGTTMRLISGVLAGQDITVTLTGDESLSRRPMKRVADPLQQMGAEMEGQGEKMTAPLTIHGRPLTPISYVLPVASAQVKSAILLAGMQAKGKTTVVEPVATRDHTERMFDTFRIKWIRDGNDISVYGPQVPEATDYLIPGDISSAAFWLVAASAMPGSKLLLHNVGLNPTRTGILDILVRMGAGIRETVETETGLGEPRGRIAVFGSQLKGTIIEGKVIPNVIDELPVLAVAGALAEGTTIIRDAGELRVKETDRIAAVAHNLRQMGAEVEELEDGMIIHGGRRLKAAHLTSYGDHRIAMAFAIAGLFAEGTTVIDGVSCIDTSYPGFAKEMQRLVSQSQPMEFST